jgi:hypothetical protein
VLFNKHLKFAEITIVSLFLISVSRILNISFSNSNPLAAIEAEVE